MKKLKKLKNLKNLKKIFILFFLISSFYIHKIKIIHSLLKSFDFFLNPPAIHPIIKNIIADASHILFIFIYI